MRKRLVIILAIILVFTGVFGGLFTWQYRKRREVFRADGYVIASEQYEDAVVCNYFTAGTTYRKSYGDKISFTSSMGTKERVMTKNFLHYSDTSISSMEASMVADLDEVEGGLLDFYYLAPQMVLASREENYVIDNNGAELEFGNFINLLDEDKFMVRSGGIMTVSLANGQNQEVDSGYLEIIYPEENIVRIYNEDYIWQSIAEGCRITLANGVVIDLGEKAVYDSNGNPRFTIEDVAMDLVSGSGIAVQSDSASQWAPPSFEFEVIDGVDGVSGEDGQQGVDGTNGEDGISGEDGMDNEDGQDGEAGEDGAEGDSGSSGDDGASGSSGATGADGSQGANGANGSNGTSGASGANGAGGGTAGGGAGGSGGLGSALGRVIISELEYDCAQVTFSFYAEDEAGAMQAQGNRVKLVETGTNQEVRTIEVNEDGDAGTNFDRIISEATLDNPITLTIGGLSPDTEYQILIYSNYEVESTSGRQSGNRAYASRTFYTASEGVTMSVQALSQGDAVIRLDKKNFSQARTARVYLSFEGTETPVGNATPKPAFIPFSSDTLDISGGTASYTFSAVSKDGDSLIGGLTSNIPFSAILYTSSMTETEGTSSRAWEDDNGDGVPDGVDRGQITVSKQKLNGRTLKATPEFGEVVCYQNAHGSYQLYLSQVSDPDNAVENYIYRIYLYDSKNNTKTLVKTLSTINSTGVELYLDDDMFNQTYTVECEASYFDNEKTFTALVNGTLNTGTGESIVTFIPAEVNSIQNADLKTKYSQYGTVGPTWMYGYLQIDMEVAGFGIDWGSDSGHEIIVQVASGEDYTRTLHYANCREDAGVDHFYDEAVSAGADCVYNKDSHKLFLPVNLWGLKEDSYYTFSVTANVNYSDTTSALKNIGVGLYKTTKYSDQTKDVLPFMIKNITGQSINGDLSSGLTYEGMTFAISMNNKWTDGNYPIEVLSARAVEVTAYETKSSTDVPIKSFIIDLYQAYGLTENAVKQQDIWCDPKASPMARYLSGDPDYMKDSAERALLLFDTNLFGSTQGYSSIKLEVTGVYDYTYKENAFFPEVEASNMGYQNNIEFTSQGDIFNVGVVPPQLPNNWEIVTATPIMNTNISTTGTYSIYDVLGNGQIDTALDSTTIRGYHLEADYTSSEIDEVTYHIFTYDDWVDFNYWQTQTDNKGTIDFPDIILAARDAEDDQNSSAKYWKDKVLEVKIPCTQIQTTSAPALNIIYDEDEEDGKLVSEASGYCYYTNKIARGQTYIAAFTAMDGFTRDEDTNKATYWYPYANPGYARGNTSLLRSRPFRMDRQAPRVKLLWNSTAVDGKQTWEFYIYDPDMALGKITLKEEGERGNTLETWADLWKNGGSVTDKELEKGYIMVSPYAVGSERNSPLWSYINGEYDADNVVTDTRRLFPKVSVSTLPTQINNIGTVFADTASYSQASGIASSIDMNKAGRSWTGIFTVDTSSLVRTSSDYYIFLGRSLNDSIYLTAAADNENGGLGWKAKESPTLYTMAAAEFQDSGIYFDDSINNNLKLIASLDTNNLNFSFEGSVSDETRRRIVAFEVTVWQATTPLASGQKVEELRYKEIGKKTVNYTGKSSGIAANVEFSDFDEYQEDRYAFADVRAIYDTGMYGTEQMLQVNGLNGQGESIILPDPEGMGNDRTITLWKRNTDTGYGLPYSIRKQEERVWYSESTGSRRLTGQQANIAGSVWNVDNDNTNTRFGTDATAKIRTRRTNVLENSSTTFRWIDLSLRGRTAVGTGEQDTTLSFLESGIGGWNDYNETGANLVFGNLGIAAGSFRAGTTGTTQFPVYQIEDKAIELKDEQGNLLVSLEPSQGVYFTMPVARISTAGTDTTSQERSYDKIKTKFQLSNDSYNRLVGKGGKVEAYLPYVFVDVYEGTVYQNNANQAAGELQGYKIQTMGTKVDADWKGNTYLKKPESIYNELWGAAAGGSYTVNNQEHQLNNEIFNRLAAIPVKDTVNCEFTISNLPSRDNQYKNYSVRLYVLPLTVSGNLVDYDTMTMEQLEQYKQYVFDNATAYSGRYSDTIHCYEVAMDVWWKLSTYAPAGLAGITVKYEAKGYDEKKFTIDASMQDVSYADTYLEFQIRDKDGVKLYNDDILSAMGYGIPQKKTYSYYTAEGKLTQRSYLAFTQTDQSTAEIPYNSSQTASRFTLNIAPFINNGTLKHGETYELYMRVSHKDPSLIALHDALGTSGSNIYAETNDTWSNWTKVSQTLTTLEENDKKLILMKDGVSKKAVREAELKIPAGFPPTLNVDAQYKSDTVGMQMQIRVSVVDNDYILGLRKSAATDASAEAGKFYIKIFREKDDGSYEECTDDFGAEEDRDAGAVNIFTKGKYEAYGKGHYVEAWGTTNGIKHSSSGTCTCGRVHAAEEVDEYGNILLGETKSDPTVSQWLTMPDSSGIQISDVVFTYNKSNGALTMRVIRGVNYDQLTGQCVATVTLSDGSAVSVSQEGSTWNHGSYTVTFSGAAKDKIGGSCNVSFSFMRPNGQIVRVMRNVDL